MKKIIFATLLFVGFVVSLSIQSCYRDNEEDLYGNNTNPTTCDTAKVSFAATVLTTMNANCATSGCHKGTAPASGINLDGYNNIKNLATTSRVMFLGAMRHDNNFSAMPKGAAKLPSCTVDKIEAWIKAGMPNN
jgi:hypothetical protein